MLLALSLPDHLKLPGYYLIRKISSFTSVSFSALTNVLELYFRSFAFLLISCSQVLRTLPLQVQSASTTMDSSQTTNQHEAQSASSRRILLQLVSAGFSFFVAGVNDGSLGSVIPYIRSAYHIGTNLVSVM